MEIIVSKNSGFCVGVKAAIEKAKSIPGGCVTLGKLIHNEFVISNLEKIGIKSIETLDDYTSGVLLIRSHGVGQDVYKEIEKRGIKYLDATCPFVKKIHEIVEENYKKGLHIIIIGNKNHPEVIGINGWCNYTATIINSEEEILNIDPKLDYCVVCQTTFDENKYNNIINLIKNRVNLVVNKKTICYTTSCRQKEALELSLKCDIVLVIGSKTSSNTLKLFDICAKNCETYLIENLTDLDSVGYKEKNIVGIVAGASTPKELIEEVQKHMSESQVTKNVVVEDVKKTEFEKAMEEMKQSKISIGRTYNVKVISASEDGILVDCDQPKEGFIPASEVEADGDIYDQKNYNKRDSIRAKHINRPEQGDPNLLYFSSKVIKQADKDYKEYAEKLRQPVFEAKIEKAVKMGLMAKVGPYEVFVPSSQIKRGFVKEADLEKYVGKTLRLRLIKSNKDNSEGEIEIKPRKALYASARVIIEEEAEAAEKAMWEFFDNNQVVTGKVVKFTDFGAFVKVNGMECLAHKSNLSYKRDVKPEDVLEIGKSYEFLVLEINKEKKQVSLGYKQLQKSIYEQTAEKFPVGSTITGKVKTITKFGMYVGIEEDVDGLVPVAEISHKFIKDPADVYKVGDEVTAQVIKIDTAKGKFTLSIKALETVEEAPVEITETDYKASSEKRVAKNLKKFENVEAPKKKTSKKKEEVEEEPTQAYSTNNSTSISVGDLLKNLIGE